MSRKLSDVEKGIDEKVKEGLSETVQSTDLTSRKSEPLRESDISSKSTFKKEVKTQSFLSLVKQSQINEIFLPELILIDKILQQDLGDQYQSYFDNAKILLESLKTLNDSNAEKLLSETYKFVTDIWGAQMAMQMSRQEKKPLKEKESSSKEKSTYSSDQDVSKINEEIQGLSAITVSPMPLCQLMNHENIDDLIKHLGEMAGKKDQRYIIVPVFPHVFTIDMSNSELSDQLKSKMGHYASMVIDTQTKKSYYFDSMGIVHSDSTNNIYHMMAQPLLKKFNMEDLTPVNQKQETGTNSCAEWYKESSLKICQLVTTQSDSLLMDMNKWATQYGESIEEKYHIRLNPSPLRFSTVSPKLKFQSSSQKEEMVQKSNFNHLKVSFGKFEKKDLGKPKEIDESTSDLSELHIREKEIVLQEKSVKQERVIEEKEKQNSATLKIVLPLEEIDKLNQQLMEQYKDLFAIMPVTSASLYSHINRFEQQIRDSKKPKKERKSKEESQSKGESKPKEDSKPKEESQLKEELKPKEESQLKEEPKPRAEPIPKAELLEKFIKSIIRNTDQRYIAIPIFPFDGKPDEKSDVKLNADAKYISTIIIDTQKKQAYFFDAGGVKNNDYYKLCENLIKKMELTVLEHEVQLDMETASKIDFKEMYIKNVDFMLGKLGVDKKVDSKIYQVQENEKSIISEQVSQLKDKISSKPVLSEKRSIDLVKISENLSIYVNKKHKDSIQWLSEFKENQMKQLLMLGEKGIYFVFDCALLLKEKGYSLDSALRILSDKIKSPLTSSLFDEIMHYPTFKDHDVSVFDLRDPERLTNKYRGVELVEIDLSYNEETRIVKSDKKESLDERESQKGKHDKKGEDQKEMVKVKRVFPKEIDFSEYSECFIWQVLNDFFIDQQYEIEPKKCLSEDFNESGFERIFAFRPNHGGTHSIRQLDYLEKYMDLINRYGKSEYSKAISQLNDEEKRCIQLAMYLYRSGRTNEASGKDNPFNIMRSRKIYEIVAEGLGIHPDLYQQIGEGINIYTGLNTFMAFNKEGDQKYQKNSLYVLCDYFNTVFKTINNLNPPQKEELLSKYPDYAKDLNFLFQECLKEKPDQKKIDILLGLINSNFQKGLTDKYSDLKKIISGIEEPLKIFTSNYQEEQNHEDLRQLMHTKVHKAELISNVLKLCHGIDLVRCKKDQEDIVKDVEPHILQLFDSKDVHINNLIDVSLDYARQANISTGSKIECPSSRFGMVSSYDAKKYYECCRDVEGTKAMLSKMPMLIDEKILQKRDLSQFRMMEKHTGNYSTYSETIGIISPYRNHKGEIIARGEYATEMVHKEKEDIECIRINAALFYTPELIPIDGKPGTAITNNGYRDIHQNPHTGEIIWSAGKTQSGASYIAAGRLRRAGLWVAKYRAEHAWEYNPIEYKNKLVDDVLETKKTIDKRIFSKQSIEDICSRLMEKVKELAIKDPSQYDSTACLSAYHKIADLREKLLKVFVAFENFKKSCFINDEKDFKEFIEHRLKEFILKNNRKYIENPESIEQAKSNVALIDEAKKYFEFEKISDNFKTLEAVIKRMESIETTDLTSIEQLKSLLENFVNEGNTSKVTKKKGEIRSDLPTVIKQFSEPFSYPTDIKEVPLKDSDMRYVIQNPRILTFLVPVEEFEKIIKHAVEEETKTRYDYVASVDKRFEPNQFALEDRLLMNLRYHIVPGSMASYHYNIYLRDSEQILKEGMSFSLEDMAESIGQSPSEFVLDDIWTSGTGFAAVGGIDLNKRANYLSDIYNTWQLILNPTLAPQLFGIIDNKQKELQLAKFNQFVMDHLKDKYSQEAIYTVLIKKVNGEELLNDDILKDLERLMKMVCYSADEARMQYTIMDIRMSQVDKEGYTSDTDIGHQPFIQLFCPSMREGSEDLKQLNIKEMALLENMQKVGKELKSAISEGFNSEELAEKIIDKLKENKELNYRLLKPSRDKERCMMHEHLSQMIKKCQKICDGLEENDKSMVLAGLLFHDMEKHESLLRAKSANRLDKPDNLTRDIMKRYFPLMEQITGKLTENQKEILLISISNNPFVIGENNKEEINNKVKKLLLTFNSNPEKIKDNKELVALVKYALIIASIELNNPDLFKLSQNNEMIQQLITKSTEEIVSEKEKQIGDWRKIMKGIDQLDIKVSSFDKESREKSKEKDEKVEKKEQTIIESSPKEKIEYCDFDEDIIGNILENTGLTEERLIKAFKMISYNDFRNIDTPIIKLLTDLDPLDEDKLHIMYSGGSGKKELSAEDKKMLEKMREGRGERLFYILKEHQCCIPKDLKESLVKELRIGAMREFAHMDFLDENDNLNLKLREELKKDKRREQLLGELSSCERPVSHKKEEYFKQSEDKFWEKKQEKLNQAKLALEKSKEKKEPPPISKKDTTEIVESKDNKGSSPTIHQAKF